MKRRLGQTSKSCKESELDLLALLVHDAEVAVGDGAGGVDKRLSDDEREVFSDSVERFSQSSPNERDAEAGGRLLW